MKINLRKFLALTVIAVLSAVLAACSNNTDKYERLRTDIVGVWCTSDGPEYITDDPNHEPYYQFYEFTSTGKQFVHTTFKDGYDIYYEDDYEIRDNYLIVGGARCIINVEGDTLTITSNAGDSLYRRVAIGELDAYSVSPIGNEVGEQLKEYQEKLFELQQSEMQASEAAEATETSDASAE